MTLEPYPIAADASEPHGANHGHAPGRAQGGANRIEHRIGQDVNTNDQVSSVVLLGFAAAGAAVALLLVHLVVG